MYVGPKDDYGYNQAHAEAAKAVAALPGVKIREEESVPETVAVQKTMESMINLDGAKLLFPTSFGYFDPHILKMAEKYPNVTFFHCGGLYTEGKHPKNVGSYFGYIDEAQYVAGITAGLTTKTNKLGFIAAKPIPQVLRNINAYTLGAKSVNPKVETTVIFTGDWSLPVKEAEAANSLIDQGADVLTLARRLAEGDHGDGRTPQRLQHRLPREPGEARPQGLPDRRRVELGSRLQEVHRGRQSRENVGPPRSRRIQGRLHQDVCLRARSLRRGEKQSRRSKGETYGGYAHHLQGSLKDNAGKELLAVGAEQGQTDIALEKMDYLVEGVKGSTK